MSLIKSTILGSAAALAVVSGASAADLAVTKPAPAEYVRVCSAEGAGFFYIPGTETCLKIGGFVQLDVDFNNTTRYFQNDGGDGIVGNANDVYSPARKSFDFQPGVRLDFDARTATSLGTLRSFARLEFYGNGGTARVRNGSLSATGDVLVLERAFISLAGFTAGRADTFYGFDDPLSFNQSLVADLVGYQYVADNGFYVGASFEHPTAVGFVDPAIDIGSGVLQVGYKTKETHIRLAGRVGKFATLTTYGVQLQALQDFGGGTSLFAFAEYYDNSSARGRSQLNLGAELRQKFNDSFSALVGAGYRMNEGNVRDQWLIKGGLTYTVVPGFTVGPEVTYTRTDAQNTAVANVVTGVIPANSSFGVARTRDEFSGRFRFRRSF